MHMTAGKGPDSREETLSRMISEHQGALLRMSCLYLRDMALAEDAVQETFIKAWRKLDTYRGSCALRSWLTAIAINVCRDINKTAWRRRVDRRYTPEDPELAARAASPAVDEDALALGTAIAQLPRKLKETILLYYYQDMTIDETAQALHASPSTISKRLEQARSQLRQLLDPNGDGTAYSGKEGFR